MHGPAAASAPPGRGDSGDPQLRRCRRRREPVPPTNEGRSLILIALALAPAARAYADPPDAATLYDEEGKRHYDIGEYTAAITSWKQSYLLSNEPLLLFNLAQAYRLSGDYCAQANRFYLNYKRAVPPRRLANGVELEQGDDEVRRCRPLPTTGETGRREARDADRADTDTAPDTDPDPDTDTHAAADRQRRLRPHAAHRRPHLRRRRPRARRGRGGRGPRGVDQGERRREPARRHDVVERALAAEQGVRPGVADARDVFGALGGAAW